MLACLARPYAIAVLIASFGILSLGGCAPDQETPNVRSVEGVVSEINTESGTVTVRVYSSKYKKEVERTVYVTDETEILINGALAVLPDVKIGEKAVGSIRIEREGEEKRYVALRVQIERAEVLVAPETRKSPADPIETKSASEDTEQTAKEGENES